MVEPQHDRYQGGYRPQPTPAPITLPTGGSGVKKPNG